MHLLWNVESITPKCNVEPASINLKSVGNRNTDGITERWLEQGVALNDQSTDGIYRPPLGEWSAPAR